MLKKIEYKKGFEIQNKKALPVHQSNLRAVGGEMPGLFLDTVAVSELLYSSCSSVYLMEPPTLKAY